MLGPHRPAPPRAPPPRPRPLPRRGIARPRRRRASPGVRCGRTGRLPGILARITEICDGAGLKDANSVHAGDGNLHPLVLYDMNDPASLEKAEKAGENILVACVEVGGCLTGEHGVGVLKRRWLGLELGDPQLRLQRETKADFAPAGILHPGKVFDARAPAAPSAPTARCPRGRPPGRRGGRA